MDEKDFLYLKELAENGNITKTAEKLFVTQAALSKRIKAIEEELGVTLFTRSHYGVHLTPEGEIVVRHISLTASQPDSLQLPQVRAFTDMLKEMSAQ